MAFELNGALGVSVDTSGVKKAIADFELLNKSAQKLIGNLDKVSASRVKSAGASSVSSTRNQSSSVGGVSTASISKSEQAIKDLLDQIKLMEQGFDKATAKAIVGFKKLGDSSEAASRVFISTRQNVLAVGAAVSQAQKEINSFGNAAFKASQKAKESAQKEIEILKQQRVYLEQTKNATTALAAAKMKLKGVSDSTIQSYIKESAELDKLKNSVNRAEGAFGSFGKNLRNIINFALGFGVFNTIAQSISGVFNAAVKVDQITVALRTAEGGAAVAEDTFERLRQRAVELGLPILELSKGFADFKISAQSTSLSAAEIERAFDGFSVAAAGSGLAAEQFDGVMRAITQIMSKGTVQAEELRGQLGDRLPGAFTLAAQAMGVTTAELDSMLRKGQVVSDEFIPAFSERLRELYAVAAEGRLETVGGAFQDMKNAFTELAIELNKAGSAEFLVGLFKSIASTVRFVTENLDTLSTAIGVVSAAFVGGLAGAGVLGALKLFRDFRTIIPAVTAALGSYTAAATTATGATTLLGKALLFIARNPVIIALFTAIAAAGYAVYEAFDANEEAAENYSNTLKRLTPDLELTTAASQEFAAANKKALDIESIRAYENSFKNGLAGIQDLFAEQAKIIEENSGILGDPVALANAKKEMQRLVDLFKIYSTNLAEVNGLLKEYNSEQGKAERFNRMASESIAAIQKEIEYLKKSGDTMEEYNLRKQAAKELSLDLSKNLLPSEEAALNSLVKTLKQKDAVLDSNTERQKKSAEAIKKSAEEVKKLKQEYDKLKETLSGQSFETDLEFEATQKISDEKERQIFIALGLKKKELERLNISKDQIDADIAEYENILRKKNATQEIVESDKLRKQLQEEINAMQADNTDLQKQLDLMKQGIGADEARLQVSRERLQLEISILEAQAASSNDAVERERLLAEAAKKRLLLAKNAIEEQIKAIDDFNKKWDSIAEDISKSITDSIVRGFENGKGVIESFKDAIKNAFKTFTVRVILEPVMDVIKTGIKDLLMNSIGSGNSGGIGSALGGGLDTALSLDRFQALGDVFFERGVLPLADILGNAGFEELAVSITNLGSYLPMLTKAIPAAAAAYGIFEIARSQRPAGSNIGGTLYGMGALNPITAPFVGLDAVTGGRVFGTKWRTASQKLAIEIVDGILDATIETVQRKKRALGGSNKRRVLTDEAEALDDSLADVFGPTLRAAQEATRSLGLEFGSYTVSIKDSIKGLKGDELNAKIEEIFGAAVNQMIEQAVPISEALKDMAQEGENLAQTLVRVATNTVQVNDVLLAFSNTQLDFQQVDDLLTGTSLNAVNSFFERFSTEAQKQVRIQSEAARVFESLNVAVPESEQALLDLVQSLDLTTSSGQEAFRAIVNNTDILSNYYDTMQEGTEKLAEAAKLESEAFFDLTNDSQRIKDNFQAAVDSSAIIQQLLDRGYTEESSEIQRARRNILTDLRSNEKKLQSTVSFFVNSIGTISEDVRAAIERAAISENIFDDRGELFSQESLVFSRARVITKAMADIAANALRLGDAGGLLDELGSQLGGAIKSLDEIRIAQLSEKFKDTSFDLEILGDSVDLLAKTVVQVRRNTEGFSGDLADSGPGLSRIRALRTASVGKSTNQTFIDNMGGILYSLRMYDEALEEGAISSDTVAERVRFLSENLQYLTGITSEATDNLQTLTATLDAGLSAFYSTAAIELRSLENEKNRQQLQRQLYVAGLQSLNYYFDELATINAEFTAEVQDDAAITAAQSVLGRLKSAATAFGESVQAIADGVGDLRNLSSEMVFTPRGGVWGTPGGGRLISEASNFQAGKAIAEAAAQLADIITTRSGFEAQQALTKNAAFADVESTVLRDIGRLVESVAQFDAEGLERAFVRASAALSEGTITVDQYNALIEYSRGVYLGASTALDELTDSAENLEAIARERAGLERQLLELQGDTAAIRALERAELFESNRELYDRINALKDEKEAAEAARIASEEAARAAEEAARALQDSANDALSVLGRAIDSEKTLIQNAADAQIAAIEAQAEAAREAAEIQIEAARNTVDGLRSLVSSLDSAIQSATIQTEAATRAIQAQARETLRAAISAAASGSDIVNFAGLDAAIQAVSQPMSEGFATFDEFLAAQDESADLLVQLRNQTDARLSVAEITLTAIERAADDAQRIAREQIEAIRSQTELQMQALDNIAKKAEDQLNAALGIDNSVKTVAQAVISVETAIFNLSQNIAAQVAAASQAAAAKTSNISNNTVSKPSNTTASFNTLQEASVAYNAGNPTQTRIEFNTTTGKIDLIPLAVGTNYVPQDMPAFLHEGEAVIPKQYNPAAGGMQNTEDLRIAIERLTAEVSILRYSAERSEKYNRDTADVLKNAAPGGGPLQTQNITE